MTPKPPSPSRTQPTPLPRVAFCFHDPEPSGASIWLRDFLVRGGYPRYQTLAVLPGPSPIEEPLYRKRIPMRILAMQTGSLYHAPLHRKLPMMLNRLAMISQYRQLFHRERIDLVYVNSSVQVAPMIAAGMEGIPLVVHVHEGWHMGATHWLKRRGVRRRPRAVVFASKAGWELFGPKPENAHWEVSPNSVDLKLATLKDRYSELREEYGFQPKERIFLFLGTLCQRKGVHDLLEAWKSIHKRHPNTRLIAAGGIDKAETNKAIQEFPQNPPPGAEYWGMRQDAHNLLAAADYFVLPSYGEAMPISISEAMMVGTPVIARNVGDVAWQIGEGRGFLFSGEGPKPLTREMRRALSNPDIALFRARKAKDFAAELLTRKKQYRQIRSLIRKAASRK